VRGGSVGVAITAKSQKIGQINDRRDGSRGLPTPNSVAEGDRLSIEAPRAPADSDAYPAVESPDRKEFAPIQKLG
jgi:hypothetical protein